MYGIKNRGQFQSFWYKNVHVVSCCENGAFSGTWHENFYYLCPVSHRTVWAKSASSARKRIKEVLFAAALVCAPSNVRPVSSTLDVRKLPRVRVRSLTAA